MLLTYCACADLIITTILLFFLPHLTSPLSPISPILVYKNACQFLYIFFSLMRTQDWVKTFESSGLNIVLWILASEVSDHYNPSGCFSLHCGSCTADGLGMEPNFYFSQKLHPAKRRHSTFWQGIAGHLPSHPPFFQDCTDDLNKEDWEIDFWKGLLCYCTT